MLDEFYSDEIILMFYEISSLSPCHISKIIGIKYHETYYETSIKNNLGNDGGRKKAARTLVRLAAGRHRCPCLARPAQMIMRANLTGRASIISLFSPAASPIHGSAVRSSVHKPTECLLRNKATAGSEHCPAYVHRCSTREEERFVR